MPNWCDNRLTVKAKTPEMLQDILEYVESDTEPLSLVQIVEPAAATVDAQTEAWGTKWEIDNVRVNIIHQDNLAQFSFFSAWGPPCAAIMKLSEVFLDAYFMLTYDEPGMDFGGVDIYFRGAMYDFEEGPSRAMTWHEYGDFRLESHVLWEDNNEQQHVTETITHTL